MLAKRTLLATTALALVASVAQAQAGDFYFSVLGGANFMQQSSGFGITGPSSTGYTFDPDTGFVIAGSVGTHLDQWVRGLRIELEASFRHNDVGGTWTSFTVPGGPGGGSIDANIQNFAVMANVWYDINVGQKWVPYIGGGLGWDRATFDGVFIGDGSFDVQKSGFAWQAGAGLNYEVQDGVSLGIGYRYFRGPDIKNDVFVGKNNLPAHFDNDNHSVMVNLTIDTN